VTSPSSPSSPAQPASSGGAPGAAPNEAPGAALDSHKLSLARLWAVSRHPYLAAAIFASPVVPVPGLGKVTVDESWRLYVDTDLVDRWSIEILGSLLVHHAGHLVRDHAGRARGVGVERHGAKNWALAADAEINDDLVGTGLRLPDDRIVPQELGWAPGRLAEEYFHAKHLETHGEPDCGSGADAQAREWELSGDQGSGMPPGERHLLRCQVANNVLRYMREGRGRLSSGWKRWAENQLDPKVDWRRVLAAEIRKGVSTVSGRVDYTYRRPSRRAHATPGVILPALERPVPEVAIVCDTSGSMSEEQLAQLLAEIDGVLKGVGLARGQVRVLSVDAQVKSVRRVSSASAVELIGGGGTDMGAGLAVVGRLRPRPSVVVVLTDGLTPWPEQPPKGMQVVVCMVTSAALGRGGRPWAAPPWARVVHVDG
jgi:predicted metal-dependent peptidase